MTSRKLRRNLMSKWTGSLALVSILSLLLIAACATSPESQMPTQNTLAQTQLLDGSLGPKIPFDNEAAFYPIHPSLEGVYYSWDDCKYFGLKCVYNETLFRFDDKAAMQWFLIKGFGFKKLERP